MTAFKFPTALAPMQAHWRALAPREQALVALAASLIGLALVWWLLVLPPLRTLQVAGAQQRSLDAQLRQMQALKAQAQALQSQAKLGRDDAVRALEASVKQRLGTGAQLSLVGDRATVTLRNIPADALAQWLTQARVTARAIPAEARLVRALPMPVSPAPAGAPLAAGAGPGSNPALNRGANQGVGGPMAGAQLGLGLAGAPAAATAMSAAPVSNVAAWDGTLVLSLPAQ